LDARQLSGGDASQIALTFDFAFVAAGREPSGFAAFVGTHRTGCAIPLTAGSYSGATPKYRDVKTAQIAIKKLGRFSRALNGFKK